MEKRRKSIAVGMLLALFVSLIQPLCDTGIYQAATSYSNAKEFYSSTAQEGDYYHAEAIYGKVYYATQAKLASSSTNTKYYTVGFDVTLSGNGRSVSFTVQREGGSMTQIDTQKDEKYEYILYAITEDKLFELATKANSSNAAYVLSASTINVRMDAIMTTKKGNSIKGGITEDGRGGFTSWGTIYRLKDSSDIKKMKEIFSGHEFKSYKDIKVNLENYLLQLRYNVLGLNPTGNDPTLSNSSYTYNSAGILQKGNSSYIDSSRTVNKITLLSTGTIGLSKTGYHLPSGKEWITDNKRYFASNSTHQSTTVDPEVGYKNHGITMYANWQPNEYQIIYNGNGASGGTISPQSMVYDKSANLRNNLFYRTGYTFNGWNTKADGTGTAYTNQQTVSNLTSTNGGTVTLYAQWTPCVYKLTTDKQRGIGGTDTFYEKYDNGFYSDSTCVSEISSISIPSRTGYDFKGYYSWVNSSGQKYVDIIGNIAVVNTQFASDSTMYAGWEAKKFPITFDKQGGIYGSDMVIATYDSKYPQADAPVREGYSFKGYFTEKGGKGTAVYNEFMVSELTFTYLNGITLYAHWVDDVLPEVNLETTHEKWTNDTVGLTASASDFGSGLDSLFIYRIEADGSLTCVAKAQNLNGVKVKELTFNNSTEGVIRYKAVATDMAGNVAESYNTVYYDITAPSGEVTANINGTTFYFQVDATDINTGD